MARYKETEKDQGIMIPIYLDEQLVSGTFEHMLNELNDSQMDLRIFDGKYNNDLTGATAIKPRILLKIIIYCYSLGVISSRKKICCEIMKKHRENDRIGKEEKAKDKRKLKKMKKKAVKILEFLNTHEDRRGASGEIVESNVTDNESGKIKGPHGVIQGYNGIAVEDEKNLITVAEGQFFGGMLKQTKAYYLYAF